MTNQLALLDLLVIIALMGWVTWYGHRLSGVIEDRHGFFRAGGALPWWAVSASIVATLVSSVTFISVPAAVFRDGGNLTYFQVILGLAFGKLVIAWLVAKPFYESAGVATSYEYIGARIDRATGELSMIVGLILNIINSGIKLLTASLVLDVITGWGIPTCAGIIVLIGVLWSAMAGLKTVIWTDLLLFIIFTVGAIFALIFIWWRLDQDPWTALSWLDGQAKLVLFDFSTDPTVRYSIWAGVFGSICLTIAQSTTQGTWQRVRACRSLGDAHKAYAYSALFYGMHLLVLGVGLGLAVFYHEAGIDPALSSALADSPDRIFPHFIATELPVGIAGLFIAAIFAAAISTLDTALTESADVSIRHLYERLASPGREEAHYLRIARVSVVFWGAVFYGAALVFSAYSAEGLLDLTFKLPNFVVGILFATILLARYGIGRFASFLVGCFVACLAVTLLSSAGIAFFYWCPVSGGAMFLVVWLIERTPLKHDGVVMRSQ